MRGQITNLKVLITTSNRAAGIMRDRYLAEKSIGSFMKFRSTEDTELALWREFAPVPPSRSADYQTSS